MKTKAINRIFSAVVALFLLVALLPTSAFAAGDITPFSVIGTAVSHLDATTRSFLPGQVDVFPSDLIEKSDTSIWGSSDLPAGEYTPEIPNDQREYIIDGVKYTLAEIDVVLDYSTFGDGEDVRYAFTDLDNLTPVTIPEDVGAVYLEYYWNWEETGEVDPDEPGGAPTLTNFIFSVDHNVAQNGTALTATTNENNVDVFRVTQDMDGQKTGLTVTYDTSMNMENLGISGIDEDFPLAGLAENPWNLLKVIKNWISDETWVDLTFEFDDNIDVADDVDYSGAHLDSNMFVLKEDTPYTVDEANNALIVHCRWDSDKAGAGSLEPMIYFNDLKVTLPADWDGSITINSGGNVQGEVKSSKLGSPMKIDGGVAEDSFILTVDKASEPGMDKTIVLEDGTEADKDTVAAGTTVEFQLESNVPENLKEYINYPEPSDPEISTNSLGNAGTYTLVFHDKMDENLALDTESFEVKLGNATIDPKYYTITTSGLGDSCTFEVSVNLAAMYNDDVITEADLGVTPITVNYKATLSEQATAGAYVNEAWVHYPDKDSEHDKVPVYTYGINIFKYDQGTVAGEGDSWTATGLEGAEFALYKEVDVTVDGDNVTINEGAEPVWTGTSNEEGYVVANGLDDGVYYLFETKAPDKYAKSDKPLQVTVSPTANFADENAYYLVDVKFANSQIPHTGGVGTTLFTIGGAAIIVGAGIVFVVTRRRKKVND